MASPQPLPSHEVDREQALLEIARQLAAEIHPAQRETLERLGTGASLEREFGFDSLGRAELLSRVESAFGITLPDALLAEGDTAGEILAAIDRLPEARHGGRTAAPARRDAARVRAAPSGGESIPEGSATLVEALIAHARAHPQQLHATFLPGTDEPGEELSYGALLDGARTIARGLWSRGIEPGENVALMLPSDRTYFESFLGVLLAGATPVPIYPPLRPSQIESHLRRHARILDNARTRALITVSEAKLVSRILAGHVESLREVTTPQILAREGERAGGSLDYTPAPDDVALIQYTSGSTGDPKGVVLTHADLLANIRVMGRAIAITERDVFVSWLPLYHDMGLIGAWLGSALCYGAHLVLMSPVSFLRRPASWLQAIDRYRGTVSAAPNFAYEMCVHRIQPDALPGLDLSSWRLAFNGAEPISAVAMQSFCERFAGHGFRREAMAPVFGLAECSLGLTFPPLGRGPLIDQISDSRLSRTGEALPAREEEEKVLRVVACGQALPGYRVRIVDAAGRPLPERREGRVEFQGPSATRGYYRNPEATAALLDGEWLDTGDLGYLAEAELYITRRAKDMIIRGGRNLFPYELEESVGDLPEVRKGCVAVFGAHDARSGTERVVVLAEVRERSLQAGGGAPVRQGAGSSALVDRIQSLAVDLLGMPADEVVLAPPNSVLKTSSGKIRRTACRDAYERGHIGSVERPPWLQVASVAISGIPGHLRRAARRWRARAWGAWAWTVTGVLTLLFWPLVLLGPTGALRWRTARLACRLMLRLSGCRLTVQGTGHLAAPEDDQPGRVLVANHASYADWLVLLAAIPVEFSFVAKAELAGVPGIGMLLRRLGTEFVERFEARQSVSDARRVAGAIKSGRTLLVFPEGTFRRAPGLAGFRLGAFQAAGEALAPVTPIALSGTRALLPSGSWLPRREPLQVAFAPPLSAAGGDWSTVIALRDEAKSAIAALLASETKL